MNAKTESAPGPLDTVKLILALAVLLGGVAAYYFYSDISILIRVGAIIAATVVSAVIAMQTVQGQELWRFVQSSRIELRKVIWPTRQETVQTTLAVIAFAIAMGLFFWLLDMVLLWATRNLTGQGG